MIPRPKPEIAQAAEWLAEIGDKELPDDNKNHLENCLDCKMEVLEVAEISQTTAIVEIQFEKINFQYLTALQ